LKNIQRITIEKLNELYQSISTLTNSVRGNLITTTLIPTEILSDKLTITLNNVVKINRNGLSTLLINFLKDELNFANTEYFIKKKVGKNTFETERYFQFVEET